MSAFLVDDQTTCAIAFTLVREKIAGFSRANPVELACELRALNLAALDARYGKSDHTVFVSIGGGPIPQVEDAAALHLSISELERAVSSLSYQCCEGDIPETSALYKWLDTAPALRVIQGGKATSP